MRHLPTQGDAAKPLPGDRIGELAAEELITEAAAELQEHDPQVGVQRHRAGAGPAPKQHLQLLKQLPQAQADATCFGRRSRSRVRNPWATDTKVT
jgi:nucleotide-binding universal stress UspA family protein